MDEGMNEKVTSTINPQQEIERIDEVVRSAKLANLEKLESIETMMVSTDSVVKYIGLLAERLKEVVKESYELKVENEKFNTDLAQTKVEGAKAVKEMTLKLDKANKRGDENRLLFEKLLKNINELFSDTKEIDSLAIAEGIKGIIKEIKESRARLGSSELPVEGSSKGIINKDTLERINKVQEDPEF